MGLYLLPLVGSDGQGAHGTDFYRPKYLRSALDGTGLTPAVGSGIYELRIYGWQGWAIAWSALSGADDATLTAQSDVFSIPSGLDATLTAGQVTAVQNKLEGINVPAGWVTTAFTWRQVLRIVLGMFTVLQRFLGIHGPTRIFGGTVTLETTIGSLSVSVRNDLSTAATSLGLDVSAITGSTTLRTALKLLADQLVNVQHTIGSVVI